MSVKFVIVGAPRTGSTLLVKTLNSLEGVCCHGELLGPQNVRGYEDGFDLLAATKRERDERMARLAEKRNGDPRGFMERALATGHAATGFKALYSSFANPQWREVTDALLTEPMLQFIHLSRTNSLRRYVSEAVFQAGGPNHSAEGGRSEKRVKVAIDIGAFLARNDELETAAGEFLARLSTQAVFNTSYEALAADTTAAVSEVCRFLGISVAQSQIKPALQKVGAADLSDTVSNFQELLDHEATRTMALSD